MKNIDRIVTAIEITVIKAFDYIVLIIFVVLLYFNLGW